MPVNFCVHSFPFLLYLDVNIVHYIFFASVKMNKLYRKIYPACFPVNAAMKKSTAAMTQ